MKFTKYGNLSRSQSWLLNFIVLQLFLQNSCCLEYYTDLCGSVQGKLGTCVPLSTCPLFSSWLKQRPLVKQNLRLLVKYTCFFDTEHPKVCCPNDNLYLEEVAEDRFGGGISTRLGTSKPTGSLTKLVFPTPSLTFPDADEEGNPQVKVGDTDDDIVLGDRGKFPRFKEHVPLIFPSDGPGSHHQSEKGKSGWNPSKNVKPIEITKRDYRLHPNFRLIPKLHECSNAVKLDSLLGTYGGYPWIALIGMKRKRSLDFDHVCAGAIINNRYVVTTAHCFNRIQPKFVRLGEYDLNTLIDEGSEFLPQSRREDYRIEKLTIHPNYDPAKGANDIALIRLDKELALNTTFIRPICLPFLLEYGIENRLDLNNLDGKAFWVAGWSRHSWDGYSTGVDISILQDAIVDFVSHDMCREDYPHLSGFSAKSQICTKARKDSCGSCISDSGGPLQIPLKVPAKVAGFMEPKYFLLGLLSQGPTGKMCQNSDNDCPSLPTSVYTKVSKYLSWILDNIQD